ncbi:MAG: multicopper oxidase family protein [Candidatus Manganitrophaceae bacterium]
MRKPLITVITMITIVIVGITIHNNSGPSASSTGGAFSEDISGLAEAQSSEMIELKNGDSYHLTASIVKKTIGNSPVKMFAYNGTIPGPLIKVAQGAEITLKFTNNTDVDTTLHSHGVRLENQFDGVPGVTQKEVKPGESFTYKVKFPDEGIYWYHPHIREDYTQELGLYGNYLVASTDMSYWSPVNRQVALFVDDILIENGKIVTFSKASSDHTLMGRFGNTMLVNGETNFTLQAKSGEVIRFYITNAANTRTFNLSIPNAKMKLVGGDGGKYEHETWSDGIILGPSERAIVEVLFANAGSYQLEHKTPERTYTLGTITAVDEKVNPSFENEFAVLRSNKDIQSEIDAFRPFFSKPVDKRLTLTIEMPITAHIRGMVMQKLHDIYNRFIKGETTASDDHPIEWEDRHSFMNAKSNPSMTKWAFLDEETGKKNMDIDWNFKIGDKIKIKINNDSNSMHPMQHPIHIHGQRFLVLSTNGKANDNLVWKDTVLIPSGDTVELLVDMANPGEWMAHCHIAEHLEAGMMFQFKVESI